MNQFNYLDERRSFGEALVLRSFGILFIVLTLIYFWQVRSDLRESKPSLVMLMLLVYHSGLFLFKSEHVNLMLFFGLLIYLLYLDLFMSINKHNYFNGDVRSKADDFLVIFVSSFLLLPLFIYLVNLALTGNHYLPIDNGPQLYIYDSFRGATLDRIQYSFLAGILLLYIVLLHKKKWYLLTPFLAIGLLLAQSRAALVALIVALAFYYRKLWIIQISIILILLTFVFSYDFRDDFWLDGGNRLNLLLGALDQITEGLSQFLIGSGDLYSIDSNGHQPHNSILQTMMNFGFVGLILWLLVLFKFYKSINDSGRVIFIFSFLFGLFHVGFSSLVILPATMLSIMLILNLQLQNFNGKS